MRRALFVALTLSLLSTCWVAEAQVGPSQKGPKVSGPAIAKRYFTVRGADGTSWVDRARLPRAGKDRVLVLRQAMEHEIRGEEGFRGETPPFEIVSRGPELREETRNNGRLSLVAAEHKAAVYKVKASELQGGKLKTTLLLPFSGYVAPAAQKFAKGNVFDIKVNGALTHVPSRGFVTDHDMELPLKPGRNTITAEPYTNALGGYVEGRTVYIDVEP